MFSPELFQNLGRTLNHRPVKVRGVGNDPIWKARPTQILVRMEAPGNAECWPSQRAVLIGAWL
jgi:hypothetical protein